MPFDNQEIVLNEPRSCDLSVRRWNRFDFTEVEEASIDVGDAKIWNFVREILACPRDLEAA